MSHRSQTSIARRLLLFSPAPSSRDGNKDVIHNVRPYIAELGQRNLLSDEENHPLALLAHIVKSTFPDFIHFGSNISPVVSPQQSFDDLLIPLDHVSRRTSDTFYYSQSQILRPHTSAHQTQFLRAGHHQFLVSGDVYRRDEIDNTHFPVFHQMEGVKILPEGSTESDAFNDLQRNLNNLADKLFPGMPKKWIDAYFPFTHPSLELEIKYNDKDVELLGCGVIHPTILKNCNLEGRVGWAFGLGLERLAMLLFDIPDIRLFWSNDARFVNQFKGCKAKFLKSSKVKFRPFSKYPATKRDVSFFLPSLTTEFHLNDFYSIVREVAGDNVEEVTLLDEYQSSDGKRSKAFRIVFRSNEKTLLGTKVNGMVDDIKTKLESQFSVVMR